MTGQPPPDSQERASSPEVPAPSQLSGASEAASAAAAAGVLAAVGNGPLDCPLVRRSLDDFKWLDVAYVRRRAPCGWVPEPAVLSLFSLLNASGTGVLSSIEFHPFATFTRITRPGVHWDETYDNTWRWLDSREAGLSCHAFAFLLRIPELGCFCASMADVRALQSAIQVQISSGVGGVFPLLAPMPVAHTPLIFQPHNALLA
jgi:hypothetical protein